MKQIAASAYITIVYPADGTTIIPDGTALIKNAPHEENAKRFIDFTVSEDVQTLLSQLYRRSVRSDIPDASTLPGLETLELLDYDLPKLNEQRRQILEFWKSCMTEGGVS